MLLLLLFLFSPTVFKGGVIRMDAQPAESAKLIQTMTAVKQHAEILQLSGD